MTISRREFGKYAGVGALALTVGGTSIMLGGCNIGQDIINWVPVAVNSLNSIEKLLASNSVILSGTIQAAFNDVIAGLNAVKAAAQEYIATTPAPVGTLQKLKALLQAVVDQLAAFFQQLNLPGGGLLSLILGLAQLVVGTIMGFVNTLPATPAAAKAMSTAMTIHVGASQIAAQAKVRSRREFKKEFNSALKSSYGVVCPPDAYLHVSFFEHL